MRTEESKDIKDLLMAMSSRTYNSSICDCGEMSHDILNKVSHLLSLDYSIVELNNRCGRYSENYPCKIFIPESTNSDRKKTYFDLPSYKGPINYAHYARCRKRFPVPVILFQGKYVCRSSTIATVAEICSRIAASHINNVRTNNEKCSSSPTTIIVDNDINGGKQMDVTDNNSPISIGPECLPEIPPDIKPEKNESQVSFSARVSNFYRYHDIRLLKSLNVDTIVDLMVENKKVKYFLTVSSSEKIDKENRYSDFKIIPLPYPGCEFFAEYKKKNYASKGLFFNWNQLYVNAIPDIPDYIKLDIPWTEYKTWDLLTLTQNYFKLLLTHLADDQQNGILIHCISGWDRTPLFVSLLRISLWADGLIHQSLDEHQILYLTLAYDWYLFGHDLPDRLSKGEVILFFCFNLLKYFESRKFSMLRMQYEREQQLSLLRTSPSPSAGSATVTTPSMTTNYNHVASVVPSTNNVGSNICEDNDNSADGSFILEFDDKEMDYLIHGNYVSMESINNGNDFLVQHNQDSNSSSSFTENGNPSSSILSTGTSPVEVPTTNNGAHQQRIRRKTESVSSVGSWQMVSACGSLRSPDFHWTQLNAKSPNNKNANVSPTVSYASSGGGGCVSSEHELEILYKKRKERLDRLRALFLHCYCTTFDINHIPGIFECFAEKVGLNQK